MPVVPPAPLSPLLLMPLPAAAATAAAGAAAPRPLHGQPAWQPADASNLGTSPTLPNPQVGGASLKPEFVDIIKAAEKSK